VVVWEKLEDNWLKSNVNSAIFFRRKVCICFYDSLGFLVQTHTMEFPFVASTIEYDAIVLQHALIAIFYGFEHVKFESDCQMVVNVVTNSCIYLNELESLLYV
jgi:hypothetical protein